MNSTFGVQPAGSLPYRVRSQEALCNEPCRALPLLALRRDHCCAKVQATLGFAVWALMSEADYALAGLRPALGRLANAMVAVLGPELRLGSPTYKLCTSVIREMQVCRRHLTSCTSQLLP